MLVDLLAQPGGVDHHAPEAARQQRKAAAAQDVTALERLRALGVQVVPPASMDLAAMRKATAAVRQRYLDNLPADLVQAYLNTEPADHATP